jgi:hypothetical protein
VVAAVGVTLWVYSLGDFQRRELFGYFAAWIAVASTAAGVYGFAKSATGAGVTHINRPTTD